VGFCGDVGGLFFWGVVFSCCGWYDVSGFWVDFSYAGLFVSGLFFVFVPVAFFYFVEVCCAVLFVVDGCVWHVGLNLA
jgi:hypothetical protein